MEKESMEEEDHAHPQPETPERRRGSCEDVLVEETRTSQVLLHYPPSPDLPECPGAVCRLPCALARVLLFSKTLSYLCLVTRRWPVAVQRQ